MANRILPAALVAIDAPTLQMGKCANLANVPRGTLVRYDAHVPRGTLPLVGVPPLGGQGPAKAGTPTGYPVESISATDLVSAVREC